LELTIAQIIDSLITTSNSVWHLQDEVMNAKTDAETAAAARKLLVSNAQRRHLVIELDKAFRELSKGEIVTSNISEARYGKEQWGWTTEE